MTRIISAAFPDRQSAERAAAELEAASFAPNQLDMKTRERTGAIDIGSRLKPNSRSITGAAIGALVLGTVGWILGWLASLVLASTTQSSAGGALVASIGGGTIGWLVGALLATRAPVEESYYREQRVEQGATRLSVDPAGRDDEVNRILNRNGARPITVVDDHSTRRVGYASNDSQRATS